MARFDINAGVTIEVATPQEVGNIVASQLAGWRAEIARGVRFRDLSMHTVAAGGLFTTDPISTQVQEQQGPEDGFVWSVLHVLPNDAGITVGTDKYSVYADQVSPSRAKAVNVVNAITWDPCVFTLDAGQKLVVAGAATGGAGLQVTIAFSVIELPVQLAWQLL